MTTNKKTTKPKSTYPRCDRKRCMNDAQMFPIMVIPAPKWSHNPKAKIEMELALNVCPQHAVEDIDLFMDDNGWAQLQQNFEARRMVLPKRKDIKVIFKALEDRKFS